ncbi:MAG: hypothetical protein ACOC3W_08835, partial [Thermodesulfobacteriota bacterium]
LNPDASDSSDDPDDSAPLLATLLEKTTSTLPKISEIKLIRRITVQTNTAEYLNPDASDSSDDPDDSAPLRTTLLGKTTSTLPKISVIKLIRRITVQDNTAE